MKLGFFRIMVAVCLLPTAMAQTKPSVVNKKPAKVVSSRSKKTSPKAPVVSNAVTTPPTIVESLPATSIWGVIKDKLQIRYFSEVIGSGLGRWDGYQPAYDKRGNYDKTQRGDPMNAFHQISFQYAVTPSSTFVFQPRFTTQFGPRGNSGADQGAVRMEDLRTGVQGVWHQNAKGNLTWFQRYAVRLPTNRANQGNALPQGQGMLVQPDWYSSVDWVINPKWAVFLWTNVRIYTYHAGNPTERWRFYNAPGFIYTFNDKWSMEGFFEFEVDHRDATGKSKRTYISNNPSSGGYQDLYIGPMYNWSPSLILYPFIKPFQLQKFDMRTTTVGMWIMAKLF